MAFRLLPWCFTSTEIISLIRDGQRWGKRETIPLSLHCHHQKDSCIKMGSDESHFNVSFIVRDKSTGRCPQTTTFMKRRESRSGIEPKPLCLPVYRLTARPNGFISSLYQEGHLHSTDNYPSGSGHAHNLQDECEAYRTRADHHRDMRHDETHAVWSWDCEDWISLQTKHQCPKLKQKETITMAVMLLMGLVIQTMA